MSFLAWRDQMTTTSMVAAKWRKMVILRHFTFPRFQRFFLLPTMARGPHQPQWFGKVKGNGNWGLRPTIWCQGWHSEMVQLWDGTILSWYNCEMVQFWDGTYNSELVHFWDGTILRWYSSELVQFFHFIKIAAKEHLVERISLSFNKMWKLKKILLFFVLRELFPINS